MGIDYTTYLGPHVRCKTSKVPSTHPVRTCSDATCINYSVDLPKRGSDHLNNYCGKCGSQIKDRTLNCQVDNVNAEEVRMNLLGEALYNVPGDSFHSWMQANSLHIWLANRDIPGIRKFSFDPKQDIQYVLISAELIATEVEQFSDFYEKEIFILKEEYGAENVEVRWGLIHDVN